MADTAPPRELPFDLDDFMGQTSFQPRRAKPEGPYLMEITGADGGAYKQKPGAWTKFLCKIVMGPGASDKYVGQIFGDFIGEGNSGDEQNDARDKASMKAVWEAAFGGKDQLHAWLGECKKTGYRPTSNDLVGKKVIYILRPNAKGDNNFVNGRLPYSEETWDYALNQFVVPGDESQAATSNPSQTPPPAAAAAPPPPPPVGAPAPVSPAAMPPPPPPAMAAPPPPPPPPKL